MEGHLIKWGEQELHLSALALQKLLRSPDEEIGRLSERIARFFGTWQYIVGQSIIVVLWVIANAVLFSAFALGHPFDPYPFILLNLAFSTQAAYAAPLILLAQGRQAERDRRAHIEEEWHREILAAREARIDVWCARHRDLDQVEFERGVREIWSDTVPGPYVDLVPDPPLPPELAGSIDLDLLADAVVDRAVTGEADV